MLVMCVLFSLYFHIYQILLTNTRTERQTLGRNSVHSVLNIVILKHANKAKLSIIQYNIKYA